jgi:DNA-directed RNA polymerase subunit E"
MVLEKACKKCRRIVREDICPICKDSELTASWKGYVVVSNPEKSEIAKTLGITTVGKYALRLGK